MFWLLLTGTTGAAIAALAVWLSWTGRRGWARFKGVMTDGHLNPVERAHLDANWASVRNSYHRPAYRRSNR